MKVEWDFTENWSRLATPITKTLYLTWIKEGFKGGFLQKRLNPIRVPFLGDSVRILGVCPASTLTFGL